MDSKGNMTISSGKLNIYFLCFAVGLSAFLAGSIGMQLFGRRRKWQPLPHRSPDHGSPRITDPNFPAGWRLGFLNICEKDAPAGIGTCFVYRSTLPGTYGGFKQNIQTHKPARRDAKHTEDRKRYFAMCPRDGVFQQYIHTQTVSFIYTTAPHRDSWINAHKAGS